MTLRRFLNVAYAILIEEHQRLGVDLISAIEKLSEWSEGTGEKSPPPAVVVAAQNAQSMAMLTGGLMGGVANSPLKKKKRV